MKHAISSWYIVTRRVTLEVCGQQVTAVSASDPSRSGHLRVTRSGSTPSGGGVWTPLPIDSQVIDGSAGAFVSNFWGIESLLF